MSLKYTKSFQQNQCIIQWGAEYNKLHKEFFESKNEGNRLITSKDLVVSHDGTFLGEKSSYKFKLSTIGDVTNVTKKIPKGTTDVFLYGHSGFIRYLEPRKLFINGTETVIDGVAGLNVDIHYVSAAKLSDFLNLICNEFRGEPLRIWLLFCFSGHGDYMDRLIVKLKTKHKWSNKTIIGFNETVDQRTLGRCREVAAEATVSKKFKVTLTSFKPEFRKKRGPRIKIF